MSTKSTVEPANDVEKQDDSDFDPGDIASAPPESKRVINAALREGLPFHFKAFTNSNHTAEDVAKACDCDVSQVARSVLFKGQQTKKPVLVLVSGKSRVNEKILASLVGENLEKADADYVLRMTGFAIDGVAPLGLANRMPVMIDETLYERPRCWIAAGTPNTVMSVPTMLLARVIAARIIRVS